MEANGVLRVVSIGAHQLLCVMDKLYGQLALGLWWWERPGSLPNFTTDTPSTSDYGAFASEAVVRKFGVEQEVIFCNGLDLNKIWDGRVLRDAGEDRAPAPTIAAGSGTTLTGSYSSVYTYYDSKRDFETSPTGSAPTVITLTAKSLAVTVVASTNPRFDKIRIYRNANGVPGTFKRDQTVANTSATIQSSIADTSLGSAVSYSNFRPPPCKYVVKTSTRIFWMGSRPWVTGTVNVTLDSATVTFSEEPPPNFYTRNAEWPFHFQIRGGPRYQVDSISGSTATLSTTYKEATTTLQSFVLTGPTTRVAFSDISTTGRVKIESWNPSNYFNVGVAGDAPGKDYQEEITGAREYGNSIYVWLKESIWKFDPLIREKKRTGAVMGTLSDKTLLTDRENNILYVGSDQQIYAFNGFSTVMVSGKMQNRFAKKSRYNLDLAEFAFAYSDAKEGFHAFHRPSSDATIGNMKYVVDVYDDLRGDWMERVPPRLMAVCEVRDITRRMLLGIDTLGLVHQIDNYEDSSTFGDDVFTPVTPTLFTSTAGEISPGANKQGKVAVVFTASVVRGSKLIVGTSSTSVATDDLATAFTVNAGDFYFVGGWHGAYETGWMDFGEPDLFKSLHYIEGTLIAGSRGFLFLTWFVDEGTTVGNNTFRVNMSTERYFKRPAPCRGRQIKFRLETASELVGLALRSLTLHVHTQGAV